MLDKTVERIGLYMQADALEEMPVYPLPEGYGWRFYRPGDEHAWARIWHAAGQFSTVEDGLDAFYRDFSTDESLKERVLFLTDGDVLFATAAAWLYDDQKGRLHWVAIDPAYQGKGIARPLVSLAMHRMRELGHTSAGLVTQTASWVAIKIYSEFGFQPVLREKKELEGWRIVSEKTGIDFMKLLK